ncbi:putative alcohol dehydrogenase [Eremomyces bilateralis CBS 781.70]|uniref:Alcohol dehydrogenase n=1 Tax=Eremomyces bilateralis CBS 781.70 TaxID=1392243 RepID=A0A6G1FSA4_9PEZI|nr:putative alcohol dehydrogenase [Eremomyces bilateralis CBS 781.70]KAF1808600.1 putative alcohol dehydrogenase [Eremomyces bilateralis CBS 781.70]
MADTTGSNGATKSYDIPKTCKAGVVNDMGPNFYVTVEEVPVPEIASDEILLKINCTGLCYSDIHYMLNDLGTEFPNMGDFGVRSPGHEGAGVVVKVGANVSNYKVGDRAGMKPLMDCCGSCELCWGDMETHCPKGVHAGLMRPGTYQEYIACPAKYLSPIPDGVSDIVAGPIMCSGSTMYRSLTRSPLKPGNWACFPGGGGGVGIQGVQLAKAMGFRPIVVDTGAEKKDLALQMGAEHFVDFKEVGDAAAEVVKLTDGLGAHGVFVTAPLAYQNAIPMTGTRPGAAVMCIGIPPAPAADLGANPLKYILQGLTIKGTVIGGMEDTHQALLFAQRGLLQQICEVLPISRMPEGVEKLRKGQVAGRIVIDFNA